MTKKDESKHPMSQFSNDELMQELNRRAALDFPDCKHDWETYHYKPRTVRKCSICYKVEYV